MTRLIFLIYVNARLMSRLVLIFVLSTGCAPKIRSFKASPFEICHDGNVRVEYKTVGKPSLSVRIHDDPSDSDREILSFRLTAERFSKTNYAAQDVIRYKLAEPVTDLILPSFPMGEHFIEAGFTNTDRPSGLMLKKIENPTDREIRVVHNETSDILRPNGGSSSLFQGLSVDGPWKLSAPLLEGEKFGDPLRSPPNRLHLKLVLQCSDPKASHE